ncbi:uncharacterized protein BT62DRAFT_1004695 [Guyanagaster necrorhizus]|uniref:Uncharacterized protein n=1 Tax=Guyanagaster necrorhizus TaxID=856835 RepID=A0A9P7VVB1_9AGAR|nr:uncharacterized protein BT62DRAFT_1004695 [Guyanagaster necrorhizus MCA 3950]KAG7447120.1 hypothetical protein BT62DRAFT_1004695 [Guyanagaster necrorhizus MCA 3950]
MSLMNQPRPKISAGTEMAPAAHLRGRSGAPYRQKLWVSRDSPRGLRKRSLPLESAFPMSSPRKLSIFFRFNPWPLIHYIVSLVFASLQDLGFDPTVRRVAVPVQEPSGDNTQYAIQYDYLDVWIPYDAMTEGEIQQSLFENIQDTQTDKEDFKHPGASPDPSDEEVTGSTIATPEGLPNGRPAKAGAGPGCLYDDKKHCRIVCKEVGTLASYYGHWTPPRLEWIYKGGIAMFMPVEIQTQGYLFLPQKQRILNPHTDHNLIFGEPEAESTTDSVEGTEDNSSALEDQTPSAHTSPQLPP